MNVKGKQQQKRTQINRIDLKAFFRYAIAINEYTIAKRAIVDEWSLWVAFGLAYFSAGSKNKLRNVRSFTAKAGTVRCEKSPLCLEGTELAWASQTHWDHCTLAGLNRFNRNHRQIFIRCTFYITSIWPCFFTIVTNAPRLYESKNIEKIIRTSRSSENRIRRW